jgi:hypothetical protein
VQCYIKVHEKERLVKGILENYESCKTFNNSFLKKVIVVMKYISTKLLKNSEVCCADVGEQMIESVVGQQNYIFSDENY